MIGNMRLGAYGPVICQHIRHKMFTVSRKGVNISAVNL